MSSLSKSRTRALVPVMPVHRFELKCGAQLLVSPRPGAPVCAVQAHIRGGHSLDPKGLEGTAYFAGHLIDQGTSKRSDEDIANLLEPASGAINGGSTGVAGQIAGADWKLLLDVMSETLTTPTYPKERVALQKKRALDRLLVERDDPRSRGAWTFRRLIYGDHWLGRPDYGSIESVEKIERRHLVKHHAKNWCGKRTVIAFCGDVDPKLVQRFLDRRLARWNPGTDLAPASRDFPARAPRVGTFAAKRQQVHVYLGHLGIERSDPDYATLTVMDHVLGTGPGFTSRITQKLRDELGLAYTVHAAISSSAGVLPGTFTAYIGTSPEHLPTAVAGFLTEMRRIREELVSPAELDLAKSYLTGSLALGYERAGRRVSSMISAHRNGLPENHLEQLAESYARVTAEDVRRAAAQHLYPDAACLVVAGPVAKRDVQRMMG